MTDQSRKKAIVSNLLTFLIVSLVMLLFSEWVIRLLFKDETVMFPRYHTQAQYGDYILRRIRPNSEFTHTSVDGEWQFVTNNEGYRNSEDFAYAKPQGVIRVVTIGDSHTQGYEVGQNSTYAVVIERFLTVKGVEVEVINAGVSGFSNAEALVLLEQELVNYQPDYVVLGFYANDFRDNIRAGLFELDANNELMATERREYIPGVEIQNLIYAIPGIKWLGENSYFYSLLFNNVWSLARSATTKESVEQTMEVAVATEDNFSEYETNLAAALIARMHESADEMGAKLIVLDIPTLDEDGVATTSVKPDFFKQINGEMDFYVSSELLSDYQGLGKIHVPNGHRHISEFTHALYGVEAAKYIQEDLSQR